MEFKGKKLSSEFWNFILQYEWPVIIRELVYVIKRAGIQLKKSIIGKEIVNIIQHDLRNNISNTYYRDLKREEVKNIISNGLIEVGGKYKNFMRFLYDNRLK